MKAAVEYTHRFPDSILVQDCKFKVLILSKLDHPRKRFYGHSGLYALAN